jgi:hypothetical protein
MSKRQDRFRFESLEARQMMAGDVAAYVQNGNLYLTEAPGQAGRDNAVLVSHLENGHVRVRGLATADGTKSLINGVAAQDIVAPGGVVVLFGGGNDSVVIAESTGRAFLNIDVNVAATPVANAPGATSRPTGGGATAVNPPDNDYVTLLGAHALGSLNITTGAGADYVQVAGGRFGVGFNILKNFVINTGAGADQVEVTDVNIGVEILNPYEVTKFDIQTYGSLGENDADSLTLTNIDKTSNLSARLGGGADRFELRNVRASSRLDLDAGAGNDNGFLDHVYAGNELLARLGEGDDLLSTRYLTSSKLSLLGEGGVDRMSKVANADYYFTLNQSGWEYINGVPQSANAKTGAAKKAKTG